MIKKQANKKPSSTRNKQSKTNLQQEADDKKQANDNPRKIGSKKKQTNLQRKLPYTRKKEKRKP